MKASILTIQIVHNVQINNCEGKSLHKRSCRILHMYVFLYYSLLKSVEWRDELQVQQAWPQLSQRVEEK